MNPLLSTVLALSVATSPAVAHSAAPRLPAPTGPDRVGTTSFEIADPNRLDPWRPETGHRLLEVTMWYPTAAQHGHSAPYTTPELADFSRTWSNPTVPDPTIVRAEDVRTNSLLDVPPLRAKERRPLVVLSPGFELGHATLGVLAEDLASHGYVVAALDHPYEEPVERPDGELLPCGICGTRDPAVGAQIVHVRTEDLKFAIKTLTERYAGLVDPRRVATAGHSIGGASAVTAMLEDPGIAASVNIDGSFFESLPPTQDRRPVLLLGDASDVVPAWDAGWANSVSPLTGSTYWIAVHGAGHYSYVDTTWMLDIFGARSTVAPTDAAGRYGNLPGARTIDITRAYLRAFLNTALRGRRPTLLVHPSPAFLEVEYRQRPA